MLTRKNFRQVSVAGSRGRILVLGLLVVACTAAPLMAGPGLPVGPILPERPVDPVLPVEPVLPELGSLVGEWVNVDPGTDGMTRLIVDRPSGYTVHGFGACIPRDCDWGVVRARQLLNTLTAVYEPGFMTDTLTIRMLPDGRLHVHSVAVFHDGTFRDYEADYYLRRAWDPRDLLLLQQGRIRCQ